MHIVIGFGLLVALIALVRRAYLPRPGDAPPPPPEGSNTLPGPDDAGYW